LQSPSGVVVLSQSALEQLLEERLRKEFHVQVDWNHQLSDLRLEPETAVATVDRLAVSAKGYIVPEMEWSVEKTEKCRAQYIVGADGPNSHVGKCLGSEAELIGEPEFFAVYEFKSDWTVKNELRVAVTPDTLSVLWPLPNNRFRWSFQLLLEHLSEFPSKERNRVTVGDPVLEVKNRDYMKKLLALRAPWFEGSIDEIGWCTDVEFQHRLAKSFGERRCWLAGDAAHQTGPAGMQSMNVGLTEGVELAGALVQILRQNGSPDLLRSYNDRSRTQWQRLLGLKGAPKAGPKASTWIKENRAKVLACLPASGDDLVNLLSQLQLELP
jgi:2-polyprenyl-6-methoxyphenol hydroxylase-like FAD-dependent oxidoreductase